MTSTVSEGACPFLAMIMIQFASGIVNRAKLCHDISGDALHSGPATLHQTVAVLENAMGLGNECCHTCLLQLLIFT